MPISEILVTKILEVVKQNEIILCNRCNGSGVDYDDDDCYDNVKCSYCNGTGRLVKVIAKCNLLLPFNFHEKI